MNDSAVFNPDSYKELLRKLRGVRLPRSIGRKEVVINEIIPSEARERLQEINVECESLISKVQKKPTYKEFWLPDNLYKEIDVTGENLDNLTEYLTDCKNNNVVDQLSEYPWIYSTFLLTPNHPKWLAEILKWFVPVGYPIYLISLRKRKSLIKSLQKTIELSNGISKELTLS